MREALGAGLRPPYEHQGHERPDGRHPSGSEPGQGEQTPQEEASNK